MILIYSSNFSLETISLKYKIVIKIYLFIFVVSHKLPKNNKINTPFVIFKGLCLGHSVLLELRASSFTMLLSRANSDNSFVPMQRLLQQAGCRSSSAEEVGDGLKLHRKIELHKVCRWVKRIGSWDWVDNW